MSLLVGLVVFCVASSPGRAQGQQQEDTARQVIARYATAIGGGDAWHKLSTRKAVGTIKILPQGLVGTVEIQQSAPDKVAIKIKFPNLGTGWTIVDGRHAWVKAIGKPAREAKGTELLQFIHDADFYDEVDFFKRYKQIEYKGTTIGAKTADVVRATTEAGLSYSFYFDKETGLLLRQDFVSTSPSAPGLIQTYFEDYRKLPDVGILFPFETRIVISGVTETIQFTEVRHNIPVAPSVFSPPRN